MKVKDKDNNATCIWLDAKVKVLQLIALWGKIEHNFVRNGKKLR